MPEKKRKSELLAPAGDIDGAAGAINAGADAVYLGTEEFSARAYAKNLTIEETIEMIHYAHLYQRKIYLTMNTLLKTMEFSRALTVLDRLYMAGLDAVIVQDLGLLACLHSCFPKLEIHVSTQLSILSAKGMEWLKKYHVTRVVPGRELSLAELKEMKKTGMELECFIHGAMCYAYSGRCLMSSLAGGRSGNRGRCAGPCRKLYHRPGEKEAYLLSMKDMCSVDQIGALLEAGIDSFKIEGRMKAAEYTAGVTSVYRKVIDRVENGEKYVVTKEDRAVLEELYIRSEIQEGYYFRHNDRNMISLSNPAYAGCSEELKEDIRRRFLMERKRYPIQGEAVISQGKPMKLTLRLDGIQVSVEGAAAAKAEKRAVSDEEIQKHLCKTGNTFFEISELKIVNDGRSFAAVSQLKDLRRSAIEKLEWKLFDADRQSCLPQKISVENIVMLNKLQEENRSIDRWYDPGDPFECKAGDKPEDKSECKTGILAGVKTEEQLRTVLKYPYIDGVIVDLLMFSEEGQENGPLRKSGRQRENVLQSKEGLPRKKQDVGESSYQTNASEILGRISDAHKKWYLRLPEIIRQKDVRRIKEQLKTVLRLAEDMLPEGIYCGSMDALQIAERLIDQWEENGCQGKLETGRKMRIIADQGIYVMNTPAENAVLQYAASYTASTELNRKELFHAIRKDARELIVYGYLPMMYSANCIVNTTDGCDRKQGMTWIIDQEDRKFPVVMNHHYCFNTIYNCVPMSLHQEVNQLYREREAAAFRMEFTIEDADGTDHVMKVFQQAFSKEILAETEKHLWKEYTKGHFNRGVL